MSRLALYMLALSAGSALAAPPKPAAAPDASVQLGSDIPAKWVEPQNDYDYVKRDVMIPMRDGVKLHTVIVVPKAAHGAPMLLERTPYDAKFNAKTDAPRMRDAVWSADREWVDDGYIIVSQDIRGKYGSEGKYVMTRPPIGPLNPSKTDDTTDAYDTIEWLSKHVPESNGKVGMIGSSYDGWTVAMALLGPHPALKVAAPESPMIDGWMGDDWFHYGAFRQVNLDYFTGQTSKTGEGASVPRVGYDDYQNFLDAGSAGAWAETHGFRQLPWWNRLSAHPAYDAFWHSQALDRLLAAKPSTVPTMWLQGLWDQEDIYGAIHSWEALRAKGLNSTNYLVMGPWFHSQVNRSAWSLGPLKWNGDTAADFRRTVLIPFFDTYLRDQPPATPTPKVLIYNPSENHWDRFADWPGAGPGALTPFYFQPAGGLAAQAPASGADSYVSDPAKPVPFEPLPARFGDHASWTTWLVQDQRFVSTRPDVLSYQTPPLEQPVRLEGAPFADLFVKTSGTDADFVVKIIDVYPPTDSEQPEMGGYQLPISLDIFRGRYRTGFDTPTAIPAGQIQEYKFRLPTVNYVFKPGHRIMVQVQSSLFPLYDRNPQTFVPNIFFAKPGDYKPATMTVAHGAEGRSAVLLPIVAASTALR
ncbi:CocE/NonD family hydrolase [Sphingomonas morindae]|uniref:CocE/NonD family hydrolase n=1 Tax=Sphingomonas morindae TaxID=1541170 RepID=A0ABY4XDG5_9SPHN|nr:CocE/NonD family hydrolase [Sphingomonas morindae]USI74736.1 CocE/NonD family hydrolase [Sphingomonas morindae]